MRGVVFLLFASFLFLNGTLEAGTLKWERSYDDRKFFVDYSAANSPFGETIESMVKRTGALAGINCSFFGRKNYGGQKETLFPIGRVECHLKEFSVCPAPHFRGYLWQADKLCIGFDPPSGKTVFLIHGGIILLLKGEIVKDTQGFSYAFWNRKCLRSIIALDEKAYRICLIKIYGSLWDVAKYLKKRNITDAMSLDGGSSSQKGAKVADGLFVFSKERPFYSQFSKTYFDQHELFYLNTDKEDNCVSTDSCFPISVYNYNMPNTIFPWQESN